MEYSLPGIKLTAHHSSLFTPRMHTVGVQACIQHHMIIITYIGLAERCVG
jgi:hypothetical protein